MKNLSLLFLSLTILFLSCGRSTPVSESEDASVSGDKTCVEILYFHGDMRCKNCYAMEKGVSELLTQEFFQEVKEGKIIFKTIDITTGEGERIADNYGVTWSSLFLNNWNNGNEERNDLTKIGMKNAAKNPKTFKAEVKGYILKYLNN